MFPGFPSAPMPVRHVMPFGVTSITAASWRVRPEAASATGVQGGHSPAVATAAEVPPAPVPEAKRSGLLIPGPRVRAHPGNVVIVAGGVGVAMRQGGERWVSDTLDPETAAEVRTLLGGRPAETPYGALGCQPTSASIAKNPST